MQHTVHLVLLLTSLGVVMKKTFAHCTYHGDVRLVNGSNQYEGRVEVCINKQWGTVCDEGWGPEDATVVCRQLGFAYTGTAEAVLNAAFGEGTDAAIVMDDVICSGNETRLSSCPSSTAISGDCNHTRDAGARCEPPCSYEGEVRLAGGNVPYAGRLEICFGNQWGTVCDDLFTINEAVILCQELGFTTTGGVVFHGAFYGQGVGPIFLDEVRCRSTDLSIKECPHASTVSCSGGHAEDVGVRCRVNDFVGENCTDSDVRLVNGSNQYEGRVEVCINDQWGTVCDKDWYAADATVVCRQLGYGFIQNSSAQVAPHGMFGQGSGNIVLDNVHCFGHETQILNCRGSPILDISIGCSHDNDAGVICEAPCLTGQIRLVGGQLPNIGRVELCRRNQWGSVCARRFGRVDASVVCRQLGYSANDPLVAAPGFFEEAIGIVLRGEINCNGSELRLIDCPTGHSVYCPGFYRRAGVRCQINDTCTYGDVRLVGGSNQYEGRVQVCINDQWGTVCDEDWDHSDAAIVCKQFGYSYSGLAASAYLHLIASTTPIFLSDVHCDSTAEMLLECQSTILSDGNCTQSKDAGVRCQAPCSDGQVQLSGETFQGRTQGIVQLCLNKQWGTVCASLWDTNNAMVVCRQLGYSVENAATYRKTAANFGAIIFLDFVDCDGNETELTDCSSTNDNCTVGQIAGVGCTINIATTVPTTELQTTDDTPSTTHSTSAPNDGGTTDTVTLTSTSSGFGCTHGMVHLQGASSSQEGRVEICIDKYWNTICDDSWDVLDATVVCRQLGFSEKNVKAISGAPYRAPHRDRVGVGYINFVDCKGNEMSLVDCASNLTSCDYSEHTAGVICHQVEQEDTDRSSVAKIVGYVFIPVVVLMVISVVLLLILISVFCRLKKRHTVLEDSQLSNVPMKPIYDRHSNAENEYSDMPPGSDHKGKSEHSEIEKKDEQGRSMSKSDLSNNGTAEITLTSEAAEINT